MVTHKHGAHEKEHAHREETDFKTLARRNKLLGLWVAGEIGLHGDAAEAYAREVVYSDLEEAGEEDLFRKVMGDLERHDKKISRGDVARKLGECLKTAQAEVKKG